MDSPSLQTLLAELDLGLALPASWYTDPAFLALEQERIFRRTWQYVGDTDRVVNVGDYFSCEVGGIPMMVVRAPQGLRAFVNVCRHRRHEVVQGAGNRKTLQCPYHAWTYDLEGNLKSAPRCEEEAAFNKEDLPLLPMRLETWSRFIFVNADGGAASLQATLGDLDAVIARSGLRMDSLVFHSLQHWQGHANWKAMLENYMECYHCPIRHPGFSRLIDVRPGSYRLLARGSLISQIAPLREGAAEAPYDARGQVAHAQYHLIWPNFTINIDPGFPNLSIDVWLPDGPEKTRGFTAQYFARGVPDDFVRDILAFKKQVAAEDDALTASVQRGLRAGLPQRGRNLTSAEGLVVAFQRLLLNGLLSTER